ncbi:MAG: hypothetical protein AB8G23_22235 [Myxococcota bacterium]
MTSIQAPSHRNATETRPRGAARLKAALASLSLAVGATPFLLAPATVQAQEVISASPDITLELGAGVVTSDHDVALDNQLGIVLLDDLGPLPETADVVGLAQDGAGNRLIALDTATLLDDGLGGDFVARAGDVVTYDGAGYTKTFDATAAGIPSGVTTDAATLNLSGLLLSFDTTVDLGGGLYAADEDLVLWDGAAFSMAFDGSAAGLDRALDLDAGHALGGDAYLVSFDTSGSVGGIHFQDEDLLRYVGGTWSLELDASSLDADWAAADLDAVQVPEPAFAMGLLLGCMLLGWTVSPFSTRGRVLGR